MKYIIGFDMGVGSLGWSTVNYDECRIEDFGVRIFDSGECHEGQKQQRKSQVRRAYRSSRRRIRRRKYRKERLKNFLEKIGLVTKQDIDNYFKDNSHNIIDIRVKALDEQIQPTEIAAALLHIAKRRGYKPFYEETDKKSDDGKLYTAYSNTAKVLKDGKYRSVADAIKNDKAHFHEEGTGRYKYRNSHPAKKEENKSGNTVYEDDILFPNDMYEEEVRKILDCQKQYYPEHLTDENIDKIFDIIFSRRDFEDGPGDLEDNERQYKGFYDEIGNCPFYPTKKRGHRYTVIGDLFALANKLSQYRYTGAGVHNSVTLPKKLMSSVFDYVLKNGKITKNDLNRLAKKYDVEIINPKTSKTESITNCFKYLNVVKPIFEGAGFKWDDLIAEDYLDSNSLLNRVGNVVSFNITPSRRKRELETIPELTGKDELIDKLVKQNFSGTAKVSDRYMVEAIKAFRDNGTPVGGFQAQTINTNTDASKKRTKKLPPLDSNSEYAKNPVVFRAINETRKMVNAIIEKYGSPYAINIEVASELSKDFDARKEISKKQNDNEKQRQTDIKAIASLLNIEESEVRQSQIERYRLGEQQEWRCMYSNEEITDKKEAILNTQKIYEVDHIVPFSRILDNSMNNKVLVKSKENQKKSNRTPLMYLDGEKLKTYKSRVNEMYRKEKINKIKYGYLMLESLDSEDSKKLLEDWKTRNLNDTRYIAKFMVKYLSENLEFNREDDNSKRVPVYAVKGAITSLFRRQWLNKGTWGRYDKGELKKITYFDHAVDAIVIANCLPVYVIMAEESLKLRDIYNADGKVKSERYYQSLDDCAKSLKCFYGIPKEKSEELMSKTKKIPSLIGRLSDEVDCRVRDCELMRYFMNDMKDKTDEELNEIFKKDLLNFYGNDKSKFVDSIEMPIISIKPERKYSGKITLDKAVSKEKASDEKEKNKIYTKKIGDNNISLLYDNKYYCAEVYENKKGQTSITALKYTDIVKKDGKLYLKPDYQYPKDYDKHVMYLFEGDYIEIWRKKGKNKDKELKRKGFFFSIKSINKKMLYMTKENCRYKLSDSKEAECVSIAQNDEIKKYQIDILGKKGGEIKKCGELLSFLPDQA